ncbi:glycosyltransferase family 2 protein [Neobacillus terrae]|uniref:glycosyltransferase family 2 protein n=1 Tax=Neobacillus terrae TaxID=3034837 RepID=UPI001408B590|nr:glycosyltransferase family 2 protein [Neobacillus terrae]NHM29991.1 glycosyltransferase family 2 protein [Neobacillus terrae]
MSKNESFKNSKCYALLNSIIEYKKGQQRQTIEYGDLKELVKGILKNSHNQNEKENLETLLKLAFEIIEGNTSEKVLSFFLKKQFGFSSIEVEEVISNLREDAEKHVTFVNSYPKISIIITTYNRKDYLYQAINSILEQNYPNKEIIVIDDNSSDGTDELMKEKFEKESRVIYIRKEKNCGPGNNRREAFESFADGEYTLFLDDDDYLVDMNYLTKAVDFHIQHPDISFVAANVFLEYSSKEQLKISKLGLKEITNKYEYLLNFEKQDFPKPVSTLTTIFKRSSLIEMGILNMKMVNDASIYLRALLIGNAGFLDSIVGVYRIHGNNITFHLSKEFLVENLDEKLTLKKMAVEQYGFNTKDMDEWFTYNVYTTVSYFFYNSAKKKEDFEYVYKWTQKHSPSLYKQLQKEFKFILIKKKLKKVLKL